MSSQIPSSTSSIVSRITRQNTAHNGRMDVDNRKSLWMNTSPRRASVFRESLAVNSLPAYLIYTSENGANQRIDLTKAVYTIGRREDRDIVLQCQQISKNHASIEHTPEGFVIRDHESANGVLVNDEVIEVARPLVHNDRILLGSVELRFHDKVEINAGNVRAQMQTHPAFAAHFSSPAYTKHTTQLPSSSTNESDVSSGFSPESNRLSRLSDMDRVRLSMLSVRTDGSSSGTREKHLSLVTILPSDPKYEETITVRAELNGDSADDFLPVSEIQDVETMKNDYEKLRMAYELSKLGVTEINLLLEKTLDLMFSVLPIDRGVVMLIDRKTRVMTREMVKLREDIADTLQSKEILLSETIITQVVNTKKCFITSDAFEEPELGKAQSIKKNSIRSVICVPLIAHNEVHGIIHLDSQDRINAFSEKDLQLVKTISTQTAIAIENCQLLNDIEKEITIRENLGRFLPPHVVDRVIERGEQPIQKGGRKTRATILFADIRGFTEMSERKSPEEVVDLLNDFFERLVKIVFKYNGVLDKYIGDCLMAGFGTLGGVDGQSELGSELNAVQAAVEMKQAIEDMNAERLRAGKEPISIGVGVNTGDLVAGYIGSSRRLEYTSIGDAVNTASRICSLAQGGQVLISEDTFLKVGHCVDAQDCGKHMFKGKSTSVNVYNILGINK